MAKKSVLKFILGLKVRQLRKRRALSLVDLAKSSGLSVSYLNEIEKGKKYPSVEKLAGLAASLDIDLGELVSFKTGRNLHPLLKFLESDLVGQIPLELMGLDEQSVNDLMARSPEKFASFVLTISELARTYDMKLEDLYEAVLRSHVEVNDSYFVELESLAKDYRTKLKLKTGECPEHALREALREYSVEIDEETLTKDPKGSETNCHFISGKTSKLFLNKNLNSRQVCFYLAKTLGSLLMKQNQDALAFKGPKLKDKIDGYQASYFAGALLIDEGEFLEDLKVFFSGVKFKGQMAQELLDKYQASTENFFNRLIQIIPHHFKLNQLFFLKCDSEMESSLYKISKEFHLSQLHSPHGVRFGEQYCRRWITTKIIENLREKLNLGEDYTKTVDAQISIMPGIKTEYFCLSVARKSSTNSNKLSSFTIGFRLDEKCKSTIGFAKDAEINRVQVGQTCERCSLSDCSERVAPATLYHQDQKQKEMDRFIENLR